MAKTTIGKSWDDVSDLLPTDPERDPSDILSRIRADTPGALKAWEKHKSLIDSHDSAVALRAASEVLKWVVGNQPQTVIVEGRMDRESLVERALANMRALKMLKD